MSEIPLQEREVAQPGSCSLPVVFRRAEVLGAPGGRCTERLEVADPASPPALHVLPGLESASDPCPQLGFWLALGATFPSGTESPVPTLASGP